MKKTLLIFITFSTLLLADVTRDSATSTVSDTTTNLQWQDTIDVNTTTLNWNDAIDYCEAMNIGGYDDWRMPNINELLSIADKQRTTAPAINDIFEYVAYSPNNLAEYNTLTWSSTSSKEANTGEQEYERAFTVNFNYGDEFSYWGAAGSNDDQTKKTSNNYVRCVRGGL